MANVKIYGLEQFAGKLSRLSAETEQIVGRGLHDGAAVMADRIKTGIAGIRTDGPSDWEHQRREKQKAGLRRASVSPECRMTAAFSTSRWALTVITR
mgnify:CR=1 FL=1